MATTRQASAGSYSYRSRTQIIKKLGDPNGLIHRLGRAGTGKSPAQPVNKSGEPILGVASGWLQGSYRLATRWPEGGFRVAEKA